MSELRYLASTTIIKDSTLAKVKTGFMKVFASGYSSLFTEEMISYCSNISSNLLKLSCKSALLARCFLKTESSFRGRCSGEITFPTSNLDVA